MSEDVIFCGVFNGLGLRGHLVAHKIQDASPLKLILSLHFHKSRRNRSSKVGFKGNIELDNIESEKDISTEDELNSTWRETFLKAFKAMDKELKSHPNLKCFCSGSTTITILTVDLKLDLPTERIKWCNGRVFALQEEPDVLRVWLPFDNAPGLARARAFGDFCLKKYGVIYVPEFYHHTFID
ncbi:hypothetical protein TanjilG_10281 [Lupinus angustifolius]|uniref:Uncharacterized protein n=1 Tax=Lupinus angustifolius TaxID=3871 RepID=A0A394DEN3_LUPAN|nr:hypothetical protein TanjilG_10281 [Lupinus angustifolius]